MKKFIIFALILLSSNIAWGADKEGNKVNRLLGSFSYYARMGYNLGGTAPIGMPATIRTLHSYTVRPNFLLGLDAFHPFNDKWGIMFGLHFETKGMKTDAGVKNYHMRIVKGGEAIEGMFTGNVVTKVDQSLATIPLQATYSISPKVRVKLGPYFSYVTSHNFTGYAYDGYLRQDDPTGPKITLGSEEGKRGDYDFSDDMRKWQFGIDAGMDWYITKRWGASVGLTWGLSEIFKKDFNTIEQSLYPIYGNIGIIYQLK